MKIKHITTIYGLLFSVSIAFAQQTLNRGMGSEPDSLNIHLAEGLNSHNILRDLYEGLMTLDVEGKPVYGVAESHRVQGNVWTFFLKKNSKWSDGSAVIAEDFVRGWQKAVDPKTASPYAFLLKNIGHGEQILQMKLSPDNLGIKAIDEHTLQIRLWQKDSAFLEKLTLPVFYPLSKSQTNNRPSISNGAYQLLNWRVQEKIELQKNPYYYQQENIYFDKVIYWNTENQASELKRFRAQELDITESIPDNQLAWIQDNLVEELRIFPYLGSFFLGLNMKDPLLKNKNLRQALSLAINRKILVEKVLKSGQKPAYGILPRELINSLVSSPALQSYEDRVKKAKQLFKQSGLQNKNITLEILYNNSDNQRKVALAIAAMWRQNLGIKTKLLKQEWKVFVNSRKSIKRQAFRSGWIADYADALSFLELFESKSRFNFYRFNNQNYDKLIKQIRLSQDTLEKNKLIQQAENILLHDIPVIPLYYYVSRHLVNNNIIGFQNNVADRHLSKFIKRTEDSK